jgi:eukaryotic-like serine/threonine-protein kinase
VYQNQRSSAERRRGCARSPSAAARARRGRRVPVAAGSRAPVEHRARANYRLGERLGAGGVVEVFRAARLCAEGVECTVAIKRLRPELAHHERLEEMFIREAQLLGRLLHPNIVSVLGLERDTDGQLFLVMEYVDGIDLGKLLGSGPLPHAAIIFIVAGILSGLAHAQLSIDKGGLDVVLRDLSPQNVLLSWEGGVKMADLGLGNASASLGLQGEVAFISPAPTRDQTLDGSSGLFAVGIMLWEMLTGERLTALRRVPAGPIIRPSLIRPVAPDLEGVVMRLLERDSFRGYPGAEAARHALTTCRDASARGRCELECVLIRRFPGRRRPPGSLEGAIP